MLPAGLIVSVSAGLHQRTSAIAADAPNHYRRLRLTCCLIAIDALLFVSPSSSCLYWLTRAKEWKDEKRAINRAKGKVPVKKGTHDRRIVMLERLTNFVFVGEGKRKKK